VFTLLVNVRLHVKPPGSIDDAANHRIAP